MMSIRAVRRVDGNATASPSRWTNMRRRQAAPTHRNRRVSTLISTIRPWAGKSIRRRPQRLCIRPETAPHSGQVPTLGLAITMIFAAPISTQSTASPPGVSFAFYLLRHISSDSPESLNHRKWHPRNTQKTAPKVSQSQSCAPTHIPWSHRVRSLPGVSRRELGVPRKDACRGRGLPGRACFATDIVSAVRNAVGPTVAPAHKPVEAAGRRGETRRSSEGSRILAEAARGCRSRYAGVRKHSNKKMYVSSKKESKACRSLRILRCYVNSIIGIMLEYTPRRWPRTSTIGITPITGLPDGPL
jgi:hypothetical protein